MAINNMHFDFTGSVVLVTGGATGIGLEIAHQFIESGATVVIAGRRKAALDRALDRNAAGAFPLQADVSDPKQTARLVDATVRNHGRLDVVVSNAAGYTRGQLTDLDDNDWRALRSTNVDGFFFLAKSVLPALADSGGNLVAVSSISGSRGDWGQAAYNATKAAVSNFVRSLALDWGTRGVRVNAIAPAFTVTELTQSLTKDQALMNRLGDRTALGRVAEPADIAPAVLFLASSAARYITGAVLPVDGGTSASTGQAH
ncbi:SDR family oxidoreductase [Pseudonocardia yunnanensis]|uniref:SDR family NAD(P)-dependent oxidoreductase n=1 Tax=Pseudonocardia yunnanensis TaxID=58107 RepID=A0ABW4F1R9_9PSEU